MGDDLLTGGAGNDGLVGGPGPTLGGGPDTDVVSGGPGVDLYNIVLNPTEPVSPVDLSLSLDGVANDGEAGEHDNIGSDIEDVDATSQSVDANGLPVQGGTVTIVGNAGANVLRVRSLTRGVITGGGGSDVLIGASGDDRLNARDGWADRVSCAGGSDSAVVDTLDVLDGQCETTSVANVGSAMEDRPPSVAWASPAPGGVLSANAPTLLQATATDDRGIAKVQFFAGDRLLCEDATAPYTCAYQPRVEDVGRDTLVAIAFDTATQTATALRDVTVGRFSPRALTIRVSPRTDRRAPYVFTGRGRLVLPSTVTATTACSGGSVKLQVRAGRRTIVTRSSRLTARCGYRLRIRIQSRRHFAANGRLAFKGRFAGNRVLAPKASAAKVVGTR
jgi:hypothetical protein